MNVIVPRTCTVIPFGDEKRDPTRDSRPLSEFRDAPAYVLLGDPGSGKTTAFKTECEALGEEACKVDARDFVELSLKEHPEWRGRTLFIDGLDEVRVGVADVRKPFDRLRNRLEKLGRPRFRLSCREADWLGKKRLEAPDNRIAEFKRHGASPRSPWGSRYSPDLERPRRYRGSSGFYRECPGTED